MNILVLSWRDPKHPLAGGAEQVMHEHMKGWIKSGHRVTLFSSNISGLKNKEVIDGVSVLRKGNQYLMVQAAACLFFLNNRNNFDFIVDQFHGLPFFTPIYTGQPKIAVIQETAGKVWFLNPFHFPLNWLVGLIGFVTEPLFFLFYRNTKFATGSLSAKIDVSKMGIPIKNIIVWPHGVVIKSVKGKVLREKKKTITFLGVLSKDKGILDAIRCFKILGEIDKDYQFWVIGKPETEEFESVIKKVVRELGLEKKIKFWGFVSQKKKFELLKRSHVLINPSVREGWGLVNIEANAMGTPVISYKAAGLTDSVKQNYSGVFVKDNNSQNLAVAVDSLLKNKTKYQKLCKTSILWSKKFNWDNSVKISLKSINKIIRSVSS